MKLTDEQRDEIQEALETQGGIYSEYGMQKIRKNSIEWLQNLLKSEQAWKEKAEQLRKQLTASRESVYGISVEADEARYERREVQEQLNQAVEVLRIIDANKSRKWRDANGNYFYTVDAEPLEKASSFLSQEGSNHDPV